MERVLCWRCCYYFLSFLLLPAPVAEPEKVEPGKNASASQKPVENGNQGLTKEEVILKNREEFFRKRLGGNEKEKPRSETKSKCLFM